MNVSNSDTTATNATDSNNDNQRHMRSSSSTSRSSSPGDASSNGNRRLRCSSSTSSSTPNYMNDTVSSKRRKVHTTSTIIGNNDNLNPHHSTTRDDDGGSDDGGDDDDDDVDANGGLKNADAGEDAAAPADTDAAAAANNEASDDGKGGKFDTYDIQHEAHCRMYALGDYTTAAVLDSVLLYPSFSVTVPAELGRLSVTHDTNGRSKINRCTEDIERTINLVRADAEAAAGGGGAAAGAAELVRPDIVLMSDVGTPEFITQVLQTSDQDDSSCLRADDSSNDRSIGPSDLLGELSTFCDTWRSLQQSFSYMSFVQSHHKFVRMLSSSSEQCTRGKEDKLKFLELCMSIRRHAPKEGSTTAVLANGIDDDDGERHHGLALLNPDEIIRVLVSLQHVEERYEFLLAINPNMGELLRIVDDSSYKELLETFQVVLDMVSNAGYSVEERDQFLKSYEITRMAASAHYDMSSPQFANIQDLDKSCWDRLFAAVDEYLEAQQDGSMDDDDHDDHDGHDDDAHQHEDHGDHDDDNIDRDDNVDLEDHNQREDDVDHDGLVHHVDHEDNDDQAYQVNTNMNHSRTRSSSVPPDTTRKNSNTAGVGGERRARSLSPVRMYRPALTRRNVDEENSLQGNLVQGSFDNTNTNPTTNGNNDGNDPQLSMTLPQRLQRLKWSVEDRERGISRQIRDVEQFLEEKAERASAELETLWRDLLRQLNQQSLMIMQEKLDQASLIWRFQRYPPPSQDHDKLLQELRHVGDRVYRRQQERRRTREQQEEIYDRWLDEDAAEANRQYEEAVRRHEEAERRNEEAQRRNEEAQRRNEEAQRRNEVAQREYEADVQQRQTRATARYELTRWLAGSGHFDE